MAGPSSRDEASDFSRAGLSPAEGDVAERLAAEASTSGASAVEVAEALALSPHREGGFFRETYRSPLLIPTVYGERCLATSILYLLTAGSPSRFHRLRSDEIWFYHAGCRAELVMLAVDDGEQPRAAPLPPEPSHLQVPTHQEGSLHPRASLDSLGPTHVQGSRRPRIGKEGRVRLEQLGPERPQVFVPAGCWLGARVVTGGPSSDRGTAVGERAGEDNRSEVDRDWSLVGCVVTPGFEYEDFELAEPESLLRRFPEAADIIRALT